MYSKLEIQEIPTNSVFTLRLADNSYYNSPVAGDNAILEITPPGALCPVIFYVTKGFNRSFNSYDLNIVPNETYAETVPLSDGVYIVKYSISPNEQVYVSYYLFRNVDLIKKFNQSLVTLLNEKKLISNKEYLTKITELTWIKELIDGSKLLVEENKNPKLGVEFYQEAHSLLNKYNKGAQC